MEEYGKSHLRQNGFSSDVMFTLRDSCLLPSDVFQSDLIQLSAERLRK